MCLRLTRCVQQGLSGSTPAGQRSLEHVPTIAKHMTRNCANQSITQDKRTALHLAARSGHARTCYVLAGDCGIDVSAVDAVRGIG